MIIDFSVENFRSIKEMHTFSMSSAPIISKNKEIDDQNLIKISYKVSLLKSKAIYGANASGKSNLISALVSFISIVYNSIKDDTVLQKHIRPYSLSTETENKPCYFQLSFILNNISYRYGFEANAKEITAEWLFGSPGKKEVFFFTRDHNKISVNEKQFKEGSKIIGLFNQEDNNIARSNSLFLTTVKTFSNGIAKDIVDYIGNFTVISPQADNALHKIAIDSLSNEEKRIKIKDLMKMSDIGINDIKKHEHKNNDADTEKNIVAITTHAKFDVKQNEIGLVDFFMMQDESEGTKKMFEVSPMIIHALNHNSPIIIDEFDSRLHPLLSKKIVQLFNSHVNKGSQLIFATHDTNLLDAKLLRRDQICFVEKDKYGASHFYTLVDFKGVRNDASFEKDYIAGRYGAIPFLGDFTSIIEG